MPMSPGSLTLPSAALSRSALGAVSPRLTPQAAPRHPRPPTHGGLALAPMAEYRPRASAPSIFGAN
eukprot:486291-Rhodomonas_salina.1